MWEFGGYFQYQKNDGLEYHNTAIKLNSARHCFRFLLSVKKYTKIYFPYYICNSVIEQAEKLEIKYEFYRINKEFKPIFKESFKIGENEVIFIVNYFGMLSEEYILFLKNKFRNIIVDNTQSFYTKPLNGVDTIYSCRKFFPIVEGGYLFSDLDTLPEFEKLDKSITYSKLEFLFKKYELGSQEAYLDYIRVEEELENEEIKKMSDLTKNFLKSFDYKGLKIKRERNFLYFQNKLKEINLLNLNNYKLNGPMFYPLLLNKNIKKDLLETKIYIPTLWSEVKERVTENTLEYGLVNNLHLLTIDERWEVEDLDKVIKKILESYR